MRIYPKPRTKLGETIESLASALVLAMLIRATAADARVIPSESMLPTLEVGDRLIVEKVSRYFGMPHYGDILVFRPPRDAGFGANDGFFDQCGYTGMPLIKRVVGLPGDHLSIHDGTVFRNGVPIHERYVKEEPNYVFPDGFTGDREVVVPEGDLFMMGDNRNNSADSHVWGFLPKDRVLGRAVVRFWPPSRMGWIR